MILDEEQELSAQELAFFLIKDNPHKAMDYLDIDEDSVQELFNNLNQELNGEYANEQSRINW
jgi:ribonuclease I